MAKVEKQKDNVSELLKLISENPSLRIVPMVDSDVVASDDFGWWTASWGSASIEELYNEDERAYIRSTDEQELIDNVFSVLELDRSLSDEEAEQKAIEQVKSYDWEKIIAVKIEL